MRRAARWLAGAGVFVLPACAAIDAEPPVGLSPPSLAAPGPASVVDQADPAKSALALPAAPAIGEREKPLPINLPTALTLTNVRPIDVVAAAERVRVAVAQLEQARVLWLPTITVGF